MSAWGSSVGAGKPFLGMEGEGLNEAYLEVSIELTWGAQGCPREQSPRQVPQGWRAVGA